MAPNINGNHMTLGRIAGTLVRSVGATTPRQANANLGGLRDTSLGHVLFKAPDDPTSFSEWKKDTIDTVRSPLTTSLRRFTEQLREAKDPREALDAEDLDPVLVTNAHSLGLFSTEGVLEFLDIVADRKAYSFDDPVGALMHQRLGAMSVYGESNAAEVNAWSPPADILTHGFVIEESGDETKVAQGAWGASNADNVAKLQKAMWDLGIEPEHIGLADYTGSELFQLNWRLDVMGVNERKDYSTAIRQVFAQYGDDPIMVKILLGDILAQIADVDSTPFVTRA